MLYLVQEHKNRQQHPSVLLLRVNYVTSSNPGPGLRKAFLLQYRNPKPDISSEASSSMVFPAAHLGTKQEALPRLAQLADPEPLLTGGGRRAETLGTKRAMWAPGRVQVSPPGWVPTYARVKQHQLKPSFKRESREHHFFQEFHFKISLGWQRVRSRII